MLEGRAETRTARDPRLDVFRGLGMMIIMIAHVPWNAWTNWIPARFGFSDATEMFVFMSGMASAIAFGKVFDRAGFATGCGRVAMRVWQIYWVHLGLFLFIAGMLVMLGDRPFGTQSYVQLLNLTPFFRDTAENLVGLVTLTYVPNYFDILPMYLVVLALIPVVMALLRVHVGLAIGFCTALWFAAQLRLLDLPAEPWSERTWFFNPFAWQLCFFAGFLLMRGDIPAPRIDRRLLVLAAVIVLGTVPFAWWPITTASEVLSAVRWEIEPLVNKTRFGILRLVHFLALAYLCVAIVARWRVLLFNPVARVLTKVGQQSLAVFVSGLVVSFLAGVYLDHAGRDDALDFLIANGAGMAALVAVAYAVAWFKGAPWKAAAPAPKTEPAVGLRAAE